MIYIIIEAYGAYMWNISLQLNRVVLLTQWDFTLGVGPLWYSIGYVAYNINNMFPLVVHAQRQC